MINLLELELDKKKVILIILVCIIIICVDYALLIKLQLRGIGDIGTKIIKLKNDIDTLNKDLVMMQQTQKNQKVVTKTKKIISEGQLPSFFQTLSNIANKNNIKIMEIKPSKEEKGVSAGGFISMSIALDLSCSYHHLGKFINDLENFEIFMAVENLRILPQGDDYFKQAADVVLKIYVKK